MASALPANGIRHFAAYAGLLGEHHSATVATQPAHGFFDELGMGHDFSPSFGRTTNRNQSNHICIWINFCKEVTDSFPPNLNSSTSKDTQIKT
jgi:hypothetical protein